MKKKPGLYENIRAKRARGEKMRKPGEEGAPSAADFKAAAKTAKGKKGKKDGYKMMDKESCKECGGGKKPCRCGTQDNMGKKGPYADGCGYSKDSVADAFNDVLMNDAEREDKKCGASGIAENKKCTKGAGSEGRSIAEQKRRHKVPKDATYKQLRQIENEMNKEKALAKESEINRRYLEAGAKRATRKSLRAVGRAGKNSLEGRVARRELLNRNIRNVANASIAGVTLAALAARDLRR